MIMHQNIEMPCIFLRKTEKGCILENQPGSTLGSLLLTVPDLGRLHKTWLRQQRHGFYISACFLQNAGQRPM